MNSTLVTDSGIVFFLVTLYSANVLLFFQLQLFMFCMKKINTISGYLRAYQTIYKIILYSFEVESYDKYQYHSAHKEK